MGNNNIKDNQYLPEVVTHPGNTLNEKIKEMGMDIQSFSKLSGISEACLTKVIEGDWDITVELANLIENVTHIPTKFWITRQRKYDDSMKNQNPRNSLSDRWTKKFQISDILNFRFPKPISDVNPL